jgi:hypothetical protein
MTDVNANGPKGRFKTAARILAFAGTVVKAKIPGKNPSTAATHNPLDCTRTSVMTGLGR